jgi:hypothetical protein
VCLHAFVYSWMVFEVSEIWSGLGGMVCIWSWININILFVVPTNYDIYANMG